MSGEPQVADAPRSGRPPPRLDPTTREIIALAVSATNGCPYCINSHTAALRKLGMDIETLGEVMAIVGLFNMTNSLANGYQVEPDVRPPVDNSGGSATGKGGRKPTRQRSGRACRKSESPSSAWLDLRVFREGLIEPGPVEFRGRLTQFSTCGCVSSSHPNGFTPNVPVEETAIE